MNATANNSVNEVASQNSENSVFVGDRPGRLLAEARRKAGVNLAEVASATNIAEHKLEALELDDYDRLVSSTFVRGYLRSYCRFLGLDSDQLISRFDAYEDFLLRQAPPQTNKPAGPNYPQTLPKLNIPLIAGVAAVTVLALYLLWGQALFAPSTEPSDDAVTNPQTPIAAEPQPTLEANPPPGFAPSAALAEQTQVNSDTADSLAPEQIPASQETSSLQAESAPTLSAVESLPDPEPAPQTRQPIVGANSLVFNFTDDCWVQVQDGNGTTIHAATSKTGDTLALEGEPPFSVMLGNARAVTLAYNGELVAITPVPGRNTLRFAVGN